jgi:two-component system, chemotaxis family, chemotaxis protein CheY
MREFSIARGGAGRENGSSIRVKAHILIVDDSGFARRMLRQILEGAGHSVEEVQGGLEALERYALKKPDLVLLDVIMDGISGLEVLARLRELDSKARVVLATADTQDATRHEAESAGAVGMIRKPFQEEQVLETVETVVGGGTAWN